MKNEMKNQKSKNDAINNIPNSERLYTESIKDYKVRLLTSGDYYIAFNKEQDIPIRNYLLSEDMTKVYIYGEENEDIYDGFIVDAPEELFEYGEYFEKVSFKNLNLEENVVSRKNFHLFKDQFFCSTKKEELSCTQN